MSLGRFAGAFLWPLVAAVALSGCSESLPTPPTPPASIDVSGRWVWLDASGRPTRTWTLVQRGTTVEGTSLDDPSAPVPYRDSVSGSVVGSEFTFSAVSTQFFPERSQDTRFGGTLTIARETMTGMVTSLPPVGKVNSFQATLVRVLQGQ